MHVEQDRAGRTGAAVYSTPLVLDEYEVPAAAITVMIASGRKALHAAWFSILACESGIEIKGEPVMDATGLATCVEHQLPKVLLLDKTLLDGLDPRPLFTPHDPQSAADALIALARDDAGRSRLAAAERVRQQDDYTIDAQVRGTDAVYRCAIEKRRSRA